MTDRSLDRYVRHNDLVWRLGPDRVIVRRVNTIAGAEDSADLFGSAALAWVAAESPIDAGQISSDTGLSEEQTKEATAILLDGHWLSEVQP